MKPFFSFVTGFLLAGGLALISLGAQPKGTAGMSEEEQIRMAMSAAPAEISRNASIYVIGPDGKIREAGKGTNGFTCLSTIERQEIPDPVCADPAGWQWLMDALSQAPRPTSTVPGVAYMAQGGFHWEKDRKILMKEEPGARMVKEPPHWMVLWPFDSDTASLPTYPGKFGTYVMFEGTPYAHLMVHQDPMLLK